MTRIVAGSAGGRRLAVPPRGTRPTADRVREALFSALESAVELPGARVLDLYAGSGALGLEALSRGAEVVWCVEADRRAGEVVRRNIASVGLPGVRLCPVPVRTLLASSPEEPFDVVLLDPPYAEPVREVATVLTELVSAGWTEPGSVVVVERASQDEEIPWPAPLSGWRSKRYGETTLHWARHD
ncbi:16S rRNA (guanine966-N2)-methyltransferase [Tamaricihabitans halophyticus]|uniref:16S rRNA (Guanine966-N2)-methyltransferase n=1 Tax=Tamaricihabitans halophyticus TaxID=1262583 RepID=A0A4R2QSC7_9PSEU|nr:16S rRNA (guanine(966)-N(2))-methyltransferase RsmD [Tamaricihabitans halophyticus]TCP52024.1 16S rRNA (guanine966-N2)-methyltransferase [Tamaricihabitans halophyticus]